MLVLVNAEKNRDIARRSVLSKTVKQLRLINEEDCERFAAVGSSTTGKSVEAELQYLQSI